MAETRDDRPEAAEEHPVLRSLLRAPIDGEPETEEERAAVQEAKADPKRLSTEELCAEFGIELDAADS